MSWMCVFPPQCKLSLVHVVNRNVDLREYLTEEAQVTEKNTTYDLVANVVHDGKPTEGAYRIHVLHHVGCSQISLTSVALLQTSITYVLTVLPALFYYEFK